MTCKNDGEEVSHDTRCNLTMGLDCSIEGQDLPPLRPHPDHCKFCEDWPEWRRCDMCGLTGYEIADKRSRE